MFSAGHIFNGHVFYKLERRSVRSIRNPSRPELTGI